MTGSLFETLKSSPDEPSGAFEKYQIHKASWNNLRHRAPNQVDSPHLLAPELTISRFTNFFEGGAVYIENATPCNKICKPEHQVAELNNARPDGKIVLGLKGTKPSEQFGMIQGTQKANISVKSVDGATLYVTSPKPVQDGDALIVSTEGSVYAVGCNGSAHRHENLISLVGHDL